MQYFYAASDLVLSRAGALTISELAATGTPAVVVPYQAGTAGHQAANAAQLAVAGGAVVVPEAEIDAVPVVVEQLIGDAPRRQAMAEAAAKQGHPHAADVIAQTLLEAGDG
jgi:UDP-N-acetylglucosamine--N-acetylmuramyl-(pentapeptide) pyrophosphoryl-undecaprenol N-acetylglucosamine transferase